ncbi:MAG: 2-amino-4-hydroxy-6-hydroxymethyldihydropteridine diphosphokinase [Anaerobacillus sp.]
MNRVYVGIGSNIGDRESYIKTSLLRIQEYPGVQIADASSIYETAPVGVTEQAPFLNMVALLETEMNAFQILEILQGIEQSLGRERDIRWGPRTIDLDILLYNHENIVAEGLVIPHPRLLQRGFVIIPLHELSSDITIPTTNKKIDSYYDHIENKEGVRLWKQKSTGDVFALFES